jgi:hypothetical protein
VAAARAAPWGRLEPVQEVLTDAQSTGVSTGVSSGGQASLDVRHRGFT